MMGDYYFYIDLITDENLEMFKNSIWSYEPILIYNISSRLVQSQTLPFSIKCWQWDNNEENQAGYLSKWKIPTENSVTVGGNSYSYSLAGEDMKYMYFKIYGATMSGGHLSSNVVQITVERNKQSNNTRQANLKQAEPPLP